MRGGSRLTFVCGARALRALRTYRDAVAGSVSALSVLPNELPAAIERIQDESRELRKHAKSLQDRLAEQEGARLAAAAPEIDGVRLVVEALDGWDLAGLKSLAAAATAASGARLRCPRDRRPAGFDRGGVFADRVDRREWSAAAAHAPLWRARRRQVRPRAGRGPRRTRAGGRRGGVDAVLIWLNGRP